MSCSGTPAAGTKRTKLITLLVLALLFFSGATIYFVSTIKTIRLIDGQEEITLRTRKKTVQGLLDENNIVLATGDQSLPGLNDQLKNGGKVKIYRGVNIVVYDGDETIHAKSNRETVLEALNSVNLHVTEYDQIDPPGDTLTYEGMEIKLDRATPCILSVDGEEFTLKTCAKTVGQLIEENNVVLNGEDRVSKEMDQPIEANETITVIRVTTGTITQEEPVPYETISRESIKLERGQSNVLQEGEDGVRVVTYETRIENGQVVDKKEVASNIKVPPVDRIIEAGVISVATSARGDRFRYKKVIEAVATAYDLSYESCGKNPGDPGFGITSSGMKAKVGVVAVDPSVIPIGTRMYIEASNGKSWSYGYAVAGDTGSSIKGNRVDLFYDSTSEAKRFGRKNAKIYILE